MFFLLQTTWLYKSLEGLNGSLAHSDGELWPASVRGGIHPRLAFVGAKCWPFFGFWAIILDSDMLTSQSRALKTRFRVKSPKKHWAKKFRVGLGPRARQSWPKIGQKCSHCDVTHKEPKIPAEKNFFDLKSKTCRIRRGFDQLSSSIGGQVMTGQSLGHYCGLRSLKVGNMLWNYGCEWQRNRRLEC